MIPVSIGPAARPPADAAADAVATADRSSTIAFRLARRTCRRCKDVLEKMCLKRRRNGLSALDAAAATGAVADAGD